MTRWHFQLVISLEEFCFTTHSLTVPFDSPTNRRELIQANPIYSIKGKQQILWPQDLPAVVPLAHFECVTLTCKKRDGATRGRCGFHVSTWHILALCLFCWSWFAIWREDGQGAGAKVVDCQAMHMIPEICWDSLLLWPYNTLMTYVAWRASGSTARWYDTEVHPNGDV